MMDLSEYNGLMRTRLSIAVFFNGGCIGSIPNDDPIWSSSARMTVSATCDGKPFQCVGRGAIDTLEMALFDMIGDGFTDVSHLKLETGTIATPFKEEE